MIDPSLIRLLKSKSLDAELAQANDTINRVLADNSNMKEELHNKELTVQTLLVDHSKLQLEMSVLKGDLSVSNMQIHGLAQEKAFLMKRFADEQAKNKQFAEEQIFNANRDKCRIYQLEQEIELLKEKLSRQQQLAVLPPQISTNGFVIPLAPPPAPATMSQSTPVKSQPHIPSRQEQLSAPPNISSTNNVPILAPPMSTSLNPATPAKSQLVIPIPKKAAFTINSYPSFSAKRKEREDVMAEQSGSSHDGSPAKTLKDAIKTNGLLIFPSRDATEANRKDLKVQSVTPRNKRATIS